MKPEDLDDRAPIAPGADLLANVHARSRSFRRRRSTQRLASVMTALVVLALAGGIAWTRLETTNGRGSRLGPLASTTTSSPDALTQAAILGKWRPVSIAGYFDPVTKPPLAQEPQLSFDSRGNWFGYDGCNHIGGGTYRLDGAQVHFGGKPVQTLMGCLPDTYPDFDPILGAASIELRDDQLVFSGADGHEIARFGRSDVRARIELPSTTMTAGSTMDGRVVVENNTGHVIQATGCSSLFAVLLGNDAIDPDPAWTLCSQPLPIPVGESTYPVTILATYQACSTEPQGTLPLCPAPLPPGDYEARFFQSSPVVIPAPSIDVTVEPPSTP